MPREDDQTVPFRGSKSRNKVSVGEPAGGSLKTFKPTKRCVRDDGALREEEVTKTDEGPRRDISSLLAPFISHHRRRRRRIQGTLVLAIEYDYPSCGVGAV